MIDLSDYEVSDEDYKAAIAYAKSHQMTKQERELQLISFVWGNAPEGDTSTKESVRRDLKL